MDTVKSKLQSDGEQTCCWGWLGFIMLGGADRTLDWTIPGLIPGGTDCTTGGRTNLGGKPVTKVLLTIQQWMVNMKWNLDNSNCRGPQKSLRYEKFELWVMLSLSFSHVATVVSPFCSSVFHFLAKLSKICEIFFSCEKKTMKLSLLHRNVNTFSHRKGNLMALTQFISSSYD